MRESYALRLDSGKTRGSEKPALRLSLDTEADSTGQRLSIEVRVIESEVSSESEARIQRVVSAVQGETSTADIARAVALVPSSGTFKRALSEAVARGLITKTGRGVYEAKR